MVTAEQLEELLGLVRSRLGERQTRTLDEIQVIEMLVDTVPAADLRVAVRSQAVAVMFETMVLPDAPWTFTEAAPHPLAERFVLGVGELLESADEQIQAWPRRRQRAGTTPPTFAAPSGRAPDPGDPRRRRLGGAQRDRRAVDGRPDRPPPRPRAS